MKGRRIFSILKGKYQIVVLIIMCVAFVCVKAINLNIPFYWDEAWVYAPAIKAMAHNGVGILPSALSDSYSRGHPLLFFFTGAIWMNLFGGSLLSLHLFSLTIATCFILVLYYIISKLFDPVLALIVAVITLVQPVFIAQSGLVLPEIFLALWAMLTLYHFVLNNRLLYFLFGALLVLTKESGVIIIAAIMLYQAVTFCTNKITMPLLKTFFYNSLMAFSPMLVFIVFLLIQHQQRGYYFYPEHISLLDFIWKDFQESLKRCYDVLFEHQGRKFITVSFLIIFLVLYRPVPLFKRVIITAGLFTCMKIFFRYWALPDWLMVPFIIGFAALFYYFMHIKYVSAREKSEKTLAVINIIGALFLVFSAINFFSNRYLFLLIPLMVLYFSYYINTALSFNKFLPYAWAFIAGLVIVYRGEIVAKSVGDDSPKYIDAVKLEQNIAHYMEAQKMQSSCIYCTFLMKNALQDINAGYLTDSVKFNNISNQYDDKNIKLIIQTNFELDSKQDSVNKVLADFSLIRDFNYGVASGKLYEKKDN